MRYGWTGRTWGMLGLGATLMLGLGAFGGNAAQAAPRGHDTDRDRIVNARDWDRDGDGIPNARDRYPNDPRRPVLVRNWERDRYTWDRDRDRGHFIGNRDRDCDGVPNWRDRDRDGDRVPNRYDRRPNVYRR